MEHIGMDLGKRESQMAILTEDGELINRRIRTERPRLVEMFGRRPHAKILIRCENSSVPSIHRSRRWMRSSSGSSRPTR